jgi:chitodextrinase
VSPHPPVVGYQLRYYSGEAVVSGGANSSAEATVLNLTSNVALLDDLRPNTQYWYQMKTVYADGTDSGWSPQSMIDTR